MHVDIQTIRLPSAVKPSSFADRASSRPVRKQIKAFQEMTPGSWLDQSAFSDLPKPAAPHVGIGRSLVTRPRVAAAGS